MIAGTMLTEWDELPSIKLGDFTLEIELGTPSTELQEVAKKQLRETPELQKQAVAQLVELLKGKQSKSSILRNENVDYLCVANTASVLLVFKFN